jgi:hypothetical protein
MNPIMILFGMTKTRFFLIVGILGVLAIVRRLKDKTRASRSAVLNPQEKNPGSVPPENSKKQLESL